MQKRPKCRRTGEWIKKPGYRHTKRYYLDMKGWKDATSSHREEPETITLGEVSDEFFLKIGVLRDLKIYSLGT